MPKPALSIVQAEVGTPAVAAKEAVAATATTPAIAAVTAVPAQMPGVILIFQKFREFTLTGGPTPELGQDNRGRRGHYSMIPSVISFIKQMIDWRRAKRCMAGYHVWGPTKQRAHVNVVKCKNCPAEYLVGRK
jgi:hypothetical protein